MYFVECVGNIKHILSVIQSTICGAVCFQFTNFSCVDWDNIYTLSYYHHQIGSMNYYPLFRVRSWNNGVRCISFYILWHIASLRQNVAPFDGGELSIYVTEISTHRGLMTPHSDTELGQTDSDNGILPDSIKPLPGPMLICISDIMCH